MSSVQQHICNIAKQRCGIELSASRAQRLVDHHFQEWAKQKGMNVEQYVQKIAKASSKSVIFTEFISVLTIGETYFFRHIKQLKALVAWIEKNVHSRPVSIWSAACSEGAEVYSLAYLLREKKIDFRILGTDIDAKRIKFAKNGGPYNHYDIRVEGIEHHHLLRRDNTNFWIKDQYRKSVQFSWGNLNDFQDYPKTHNNWDVIICRNAFIYFSQKQILSILEAMSNRLSKTSSIWLGVNDALFDISPVVQRHSFERYTYYVSMDSKLKKNEESGLDNVKKASKLVAKTKVYELTKAEREQQLKRCLDRKLYQMAQEILNKELSLKPSDLSYLLTQGSIFAVQHQFDRATKFYQSAKQHYRNDPEIYYLEGLLFYKQKLMTMAKSAFERTLALDNLFWSANIYLGQIELQSRRVLQAEVHFEEALELLQKQTRPIVFQSFLVPSGYHENPQESKRFIMQQLEMLR